MLMHTAHLQKHLGSQIELSVRLESSRDSTLGGVLDPELFSAEEAVDAALRAGPQP